MPHTRIHEYKHFTPWEQHARTVAFAVFSKTTAPEDIPYYPVRRPADKELLKKYYAMALETRAVSFVGRLATYRYIDMHNAIAESLDFAKVFLKHYADKAAPCPRFTPSVEAQIQNQNV